MNHELRIKNYALCIVHLALCIVLCACTPQRIIPTAHNRDSIHAVYRDSTHTNDRYNTRAQIVRDSLYIYARDSIFVDRYRAHDTVFLTSVQYKIRYKDLYQYIHDTVSIATHDTTTIVIRDTVQTATTDSITQQVAVVPGYYKRTSVGFWVLLAILLALIGIWAVKLYIKIKTGHF